MTKREALQILRVVESDINGCDFFIREVIRHDGPQSQITALETERNRACATLRALKDCQPIADALRKH